MEEGTVMKRPLLASLLVLTMLLALAGTTSASLVDIEDDPHREAIEKMVVYSDGFDHSVRGYPTSHSILVRPLSVPSCVVLRVSQ